MVSNRERQIQELKERLKEAESRLYDEQIAKEDAEDETIELERKFKNLSSCKDDMKDRLVELKDEIEARSRTIVELNSKVVAKDEEISALTNGKKVQTEAQAKALEEKRVGEEKLFGLRERQKKMEAIKDEMEEATEKEKRKREDAEKERKSLETEYKTGQTRLHELERERADQEQAIQQLDIEVTAKLTKLGEVEAGICKNQSSIRELQTKVETYELELDGEKQGKLAAELKRSDLAKTMERLVDNLEECNLTTKTQAEINAKMEAKAHEVRRDTEEQNISQEATLLRLRKKHQEVAGEMEAQAEVLRKMKAKTERDIYSVTVELKETIGGHERAAYDVVIGEKNLREAKDTLAGLEKKLKLEEVSLRKIWDEGKLLTAAKASKQNELEVLQQKASVLAGEKAQLGSQLDASVKEGEAEERERLSLLARYRTLEHEYDGIKEHHDDEIMEKEDLLHLLQKSNTDANVWQNKYEKEVVHRLEDLEAIKMKLQARLAEAEDVMNTQSKRLQAEEERKAAVMRNLEEYRRKMDMATTLLSQSDRESKQKEREVCEWRAKADMTSTELGAMQAQCRDVAAELFKIKSGSEDSAEKLDEVRRENLGLAKEIQDLGEQIREGGRTVHEIEKQRKQLESEKGDLQLVLHDVEMALEEDEIRLKELTQQIEDVKKGVEDRLRGMDEAFMVTKANHNKAMERVQEEVESQSKTKAEALRARQMHEQTLLELETGLQTTQLKCVELQVVSTGGHFRFFCQHFAFAFHSH